MILDASLVGVAYNLDFNVNMIMIIYVSQRDTK